jgi:hypothetical protein
MRRWRGSGDLPARLGLYYAQVCPVAAGSPEAAIANRWALIGSGQKDKQCFSKRFTDKLL